MSQTIARLEQWYRSQCNDDWEHQYGVKIDTIDNPGWQVEIDLVKTSLEGRAFAPVSNHPSEVSWLECAVEGQVFRAFGGVQNLGDILNVFLAWAESTDPEGRSETQ